MAERRRTAAGPAGLELRVEVHWCVQCCAERTVQVVQLATDPEPVAMCCECGGGVDMWLSADVVEPVGHTGRPTHRSRSEQGAA